MVRILKGIFENHYWQFVWPVPSRIRWDGKGESLMGRIFHRQWFWWGFFWKYYVCRIRGHIYYEIDHCYGPKPMRKIWCWRCSQGFVYQNTCEVNPEHGFSKPYRITYKESSYNEYWDRYSRYREVNWCDDCAERRPESPLIESIEPITEEVA